MNSRIAMLLGLTLLSATACVRSLDPFCPPAAQQPRPDLNGTWLESDDQGQALPSRRWVFADGLVSTTNDDEQAGGLLAVSFFQAGDAWFADSSPEDIKSSADGWWLLHHAPLHHVCRLAVVNDQLRVTPLDQEWLRHELETNSPAVEGIQLTHAGNDLFTAQPTVWLRLLTVAGADTNAFPANRTIVLHRRP